MEKVLDTFHKNFSSLRLPEPQKNLSQIFTMRTWCGIWKYSLFKCRDLFLTADSHTGPYSTPKLPLKCSYQFMALGTSATENKILAWTL